MYILQLNAAFFSFWQYIEIAHEQMNNNTLRTLLIVTVYEQPFFKESKAAGIFDPSMYIKLLLGLSDIVVNHDIL